MYISDSLKESTREKRGTGIHSKVSGQTKIPGNWMDFLRDPTPLCSSANEAREGPILSQES